MDPKNPDILYAAAYQRRRAVGQLIGGGPESGLYKSTNAGQTWTKLTKGLPTVELGRIGLAINWRNPRTLYALVTAQLGQGGFFRSDDAGATWSRIGRMTGGGRGGRGGAAGGTPRRRACAAGRSESGEAVGRCAGAGWPRRRQRRLLSRRRSRLLQRDLRRRPRSRNHLVAADQRRPQHRRRQDLVAGRHARRARRSSRHRVRSRRQEPRHPGERRRPLRDLRRHEDVAALHQPAAVAVLPRRHRQREAVLQRLRRRPGQRHHLRAVAHRQPRPASAPATGTASAAATASSRASIPRIPPRSTCSRRRGRSAGSISPAGARSPSARGRRTRASTANRRRRQPRRRRAADAAADSGRRASAAGTGTRRSSSARTTAAGSITAASGSTAATIAATRGSPSAPTSRGSSTPRRSRSWARSGRPRRSRSTRRRPRSARSPRSTNRRCSTGCSTSAPTTGWCRSARTAAGTGARPRSSRAWPNTAYVTDVFASPRDANTVFATMNNYQRGDFKPYVLRSTDRGRTWTSIAGNLPARSGAWSVVQDHVNGNLLFAGLEFGVWFTVDGGQSWTQLKAGLPTIQARDLGHPAARTRPRGRNVRPRRLRPRRLLGPARADAPGADRGGPAAAASRHLSLRGARAAAGRVGQRDDAESADRRGVHVCRGQGARRGREARADDHRRRGTAGAAPRGAEDDRLESGDLEPAGRPCLNGGGPRRGRTWRRRSGGGRRRGTLAQEPGLAREQQAPVRARPAAASQPAAPIHSRRDSGDVADRRLRWSRRAATARRSGGSRAKR